MPGRHPPTGSDGTNSPLATRARLSPVTCQPCMWSPEKSVGFSVILSVYSTICGGPTSPGTSNGLSSCHGPSFYIRPSTSRSPTFGRRRLATSHFLSLFAMYGVLVRLSTGSTNATACSDRFSHWQCGQAGSQARLSSGPPCPTDPLGTCLQSRVDSPQCTIQCRLPYRNRRFNHAVFNHKNAYIDIGIETNIE